MESQSFVDVRRCSKLGILKNFGNFTGKHLCWSLFLIKFQAWMSAILLKRDSNSGVFLWSLRNFLRTTFLQNTSSGSFCKLKFPKRVASCLLCGFANSPANLFWYFISVAHPVTFHVICFDVFLNQDFNILFWLASLTLVLLTQD